MFPTAGISLKASHFEEAMASPAVGLWFEVHAENYMVAGGPRLAMLERARSARPLSLHGVGLSLAGTEMPDARHVTALKELVDRFDPVLVSEHLAWSRLGSRCMPDLLPFPRSREALAVVCRNIDFVQSALRRQMLIENTSHYMPIEGHAWSETEFLAEIVRRTGCRLLLDLTNVHVSSTNLGFCATNYLDRFPGEAVEELHLAGAQPDLAAGLLIDDHGALVAEAVWALLDRFLRKHGPRPVLIERDREVPPFAELMRETERAATAIAIHKWENIHV
jgi:uncharacterized protein